MRRTLALLLVVLLAALAGCSSGSPDVPRENATAPATATATPTGVPMVTPRPVEPSDSDFDGDGLSNERERTLGTYPRGSDTDADGFHDATEVRLGTEPTDADTDGDGLADVDEVQQHGTDPTDADTDGDGLDDGLELDPPAALSAADPLHKDVFVEIDAMTGTTVSRGAFETVVDRYASAPVGNPDGERGIRVHLRYDDTVPATETLYWCGTDGEANDFCEYERRYADYARAGHHYVLVARYAKTDGTYVNGMAEVGRFAIVGNTGVSAGMRGSLFMHEFGHSVGLVPDERYGGSISGLDTDAVPLAEYPSVMNYNSPDDYYRYSTGGNGPRDNDDWATIARTVQYSVSTAAVDGDAPSDKRVL
ncbi:MAG: hypothetical protein ABEJ68_09255 [Halobacteriaceae archaeon]